MRVLRCVACSTSPLRKLHRYRAHPKSEGRVFHGHLYSCPGCALIQLAPMPDNASLDEFYRAEYRSDDFAAVWEQDSRDQLAASGGASGLTALLRRHNSTPGIVLEIGAGIGHHRRAAQLTFPQASVWC